MTTDAHGNTLARPGAEAEPPARRHHPVRRSRPDRPGRSAARLGPVRCGMAHRPAPPIPAAERVMITVTGRTAAWAVLVLALAGCAAFLAFWAFAGTVTPSEGVLGAVAATFAAAACAWLFGKRSRGRHRS